MKRKKVRKINKVLLFVGGCLLMSNNIWAAGLLEAPIAYSVGVQPESSIFRDFDGDGVLDMAVANTGSANITVRIGNGDGTFQNAVNYGVGVYPSSLKTSDLDGNGKLDMVVANNGGNTVSVLLGNGDGTFQAQVNYTAGGDPYRVAIGDLDGDGTLDLAVTSYSPESLSVLFGNGDGSFQPEINTSVGFSAASLVMYDLNGDDDQDLVAADIFGNAVRIMLGNGDGTFQPSVSYGVGLSPTIIAISDLDSDGVQDMAVSNVGSGNVSVLIGNEDGTVEAAVNYTSGEFDSYPYGVAIGDLNGDGVQDLATANYGSNNVSILLGNGDGTFLSADTYDGGTTPYRVAIADLNNDGAKDLAVSNFSDAAVSILINRGENLDKDFDGVLDSIDNCLAWGNPLQKDMDGDGIGNLCEPGDGKTDTDGDGIHDAIDNCVNVPNPLQTDLDHDNIGFVCEPGPDLTDTDGDHIADSKDNCPSDPNPRQKDLDKDGVGTVCDADESSYALYSRMLWAENREMYIINKKTSTEATYMTAYERAIFFETFTFESMIRQRNGDEARMNCVCHTTKWESKWGNPKRAIIGPDADFPGVVQDGWNHVDGPVENIDCLACHYVGDHKSGVVKLVDSDAAGDVIYEYDPDDPSSIDPFCWSCHDSDGWTSGFQRTPFSDRVVVPDQYNNHYGNECTSCHSSSSGSFNGHALFFGG